MSEQLGKLVLISRRLLASRRSKKVDLSEKLFVDVYGRQSELHEMVDTSEQESDDRRNPFGTARTVRFVVLMTVAFVLVVIAMYCLIIEFGGADPHDVIFIH